MIDPVKKKGGARAGAKPISCDYAAYYWQAIQIRFPQYVGD